MIASDFARLMAQVRALTPQEKVVLCDALGTPVTQLLEERKKQHAEEYVATMNKIVGGDIRSSSRKTQLFYARSIVAYTLRREKYTLQEIGAYLGGRNHATIINACELMKDALQYPRQYWDLIHIYNKFKQATNDGEGQGDSAEGKEDA